MRAWDPMAYGVHIDPLDDPRAMLAMVRDSEELGFGSVWIADSQVLWREAYVLMAAAAMTTSRICIGSGVTNPLTRDPTVIASAFSTLDELAPGRIRMGIGTGDSAMRTIGRKPATMAEFERILRELTGMLAGQDSVGQPPTFPLSFPRTVPVVVSATGPKGLRVAARTGDGAILQYLSQADALGRAKATIAEEARTTGRDLVGFQYYGWLPTNVDHDPERARRAVRVHVARHLITATANLPGIDPELIARLRAGYRFEEHMHPMAKHAELVPLDIVDRFALVGTPEEVAGQLRRLVDVGLDNFVIVPRGDFGAISRLFVEETLPLLRD